jgi:poly(A) polymerase
MDLLRAEMAEVAPIAELGYRYGKKLAMDIELLRAAISGRQLQEGFRNELDRGAAAEFPVRAADLMPELQGPALGRRLKELEQRWINSDFELNASELLAGDKTKG